jgi:hypothetical protein
MEFRQMTLHNRIHASKHHATATSAVKPNDKGVTPITDTLTRTCEPGSTFADTASG